MIEDKSPARLNYFDHRPPVNKKPDGYEWKTVVWRESIPYCLKCNLKIDECECDK